MAKQPKDTPQDEPTQQQNKVTIDGVEHPVDSLSQEARNLLVNITATDNEIKRLRIQIGIAEAARQSFGEKLRSQLGDAGKGKA